MNNSKAGGKLDKIKDLKSRIFFTIGILVIYRIGTYLPLPGIDPLIFKQISSQNQSGILGMLNMFSGGALGRMTIFSLNVILLLAPNNWFSRQILDINIELYLS